MGALCEKQQAPIQSKKCYKCQQSSASLHTFPECQHQICKFCLPSLPQQQLICPITHNNSMNLGRQLYISVRKFNEDTQLCSKKHRMIWKDEFNLCGTCKIHLHGYRCKICNQTKCTLCSKAFDAKRQKCPNKHSIIWRSSPIPCLLCGLKKHGWSCKDCRWYACSECCDTRYNSSNCPNLHSLIWKSSKEQCTVCKTKSSCFSCEACVANFCLKCSSYQFDKNKCPNQHKTSLSSKKQCVKCELEMPGMSCSECNYHFCSKCDTQKYSTNIRNRQQAYTSIRIVYQNPLLQFQQKSSIDLMKKTADKINKRPTLSIRIDDSSVLSGIRSTNNPIEAMKKDIEDNPKDIGAYIKLADMYREMESYIEEVEMYVRILEVFKDNLVEENEELLLKTGHKALERAVEMKYVKSCIIILENLIGIWGKSEREEIRESLSKWRLLRIEQIALSRDVELAREQLEKIEERGEEYERVKRMLEEEAI